MKVLIVSSGNAGDVTPFVKQQSESLRKNGVEIDFYLIKGHGIFGYLRNLKSLKSKLNKTRFDLIHAHFGLSGALAVLQNKVPVIVTFHGCDLNEYKLRIISKYFVSPQTKSNIVVNQAMLQHLPSKKTTMIPCGIDLEQLPIMDKKEARKKLGLDLDKKYILFSSSFDRIEKNSPLAIEAIKNIYSHDVVLLEFKGYTYDSIRYLFSAIDVALLSSIREGSPQFIKEAMAFNRPIVSTDVGDVSWVIDKTEGCFICNYDPIAMAQKINNALEFSLAKGYTRGRERIIELRLDSSSIASRVADLYYTVQKI